MSKAWKTAQLHFDALQWMRLQSATEQALYELSEAVSDAWDSGQKLDFATFGGRKRATAGDDEVFVILGDKYIGIEIDRDDDFGSRLESSEARVVKAANGRSIRWMNDDGDEWDSAHIFFGTDEELISAIDVILTALRGAK